MIDEIQILQGTGLNSKICLGEYKQENVMEELKQEFKEIERLEEEEEEELKKFLKNLARQDEHKQSVQKVYEDVETFVNLNRKIINLTELMEEEPENFREIHDQLESLISDHDQLEERLLEELKKLGVPEDKLQILYKTDQKIEEIDQQIVEQIGEKRSIQAEKILQNRTTIYFKYETLNKFLTAVEREQVRKRAEMPGVFGFQNIDEGLLLNKFLEMENLLESEKQGSQYGAFDLDEQIKYILENYGNQRNIIFTHSHPIRDFTHSNTDKDLITQTNNIGVIGVPVDSKTIYPVPEKLNGGDWLNLPSKVVRNGQVLSDEELEQSFPVVLKYNEALKKAIAKGSDKRWPNYI